MGEGSDEETPEFPEDIALQNLADALDPDVRKDAAEILGDIGSDRALEGLADAMFNDPDEAVKDAAIDSMASQDFDRLLDILQNDPEPIMRRAAAICLGRKGDPKALNPLGNSLVGQPDADEDVRAAAASALGELLQPEAVEPLSQALKQDDSPKVRKACAGGLAALGQGKGSGPLEQALAEDSEEDVRASAADALGELLSPDSLPALLEGRSNDPSPKVRGACSNAISRYTQSSLEQALESSSDPSVRASAAQVLGEQGNSSAADNLIDALQDPAEEVRRTAEEAVQNLGTVTPLENGGGLLSQDSGTSMIPGTTTGQAAELPHLPVFEVEGADGVDFLRTAVGARYEGGQWYPDQQAGLPYASESPVPDLGLLAQATASPAQTNTSLISVRPTGEEQWIPEGKVPISSQPSRLSVQGTLYPDSETFATDQRVASYNWTSNAPGYSQEQLRQASISPHYAHTTLPEGIPERVGELAQRITSGHSTPYQKAKAIEQYLKSNYTYRLSDPSAGGVPQGQDPVDWFLFENREGTCGNFSSAFVVLARSVGLSARVVSGWSIVPEGGAQTVYTDQAHQRAEVAFEGLGWVPFEPTAGGGAPARAESGEEGSAVSRVERQEIENLIEQLSSDQPENQEQTRQDLEDTGAQFTETENGGVVCTKEGQALGLGVGTTTRQVEKPGSRGGEGDGSGSGDGSGGGGDAEISATTESSGDAGDRFPVFFVSGAAHTRYLRSAVGDVYEDGRWRQLDRASLDYDTRQSIPHLVRNEIAKAGPSTLLAAGGLTNSGLLVGYDVNPSVTYTDSIVIEASPRLGNLPAGVVPTSQFLDQVNSDGHFDPVSGTFSLDASTESFSYVSQIPQFSRAQLEAATVASNSAYTQLPSGLPERIRDLALEITGGHDSPYAKAKALESYLSTQYTYRFADGSGRENSPDGRDPVDWFLFDHLEGTCGVFSTAFVVMARSIGIPARVAAGWAIGPTGERQEVFTDQAHQWAEVAFEGLGWVQFEPTASLGAPSRAASVSEEAPQTQFQGGEDSQSSAAEEEAPETATPVESETQEQPISEEEAPETTTPVESETQEQPISEEETPETATPEESETQEPPISEEERPEEDSQPTLKHTQPATPTITVTSITSWPAEVRRKTAFAIGGTVRTDSNSSVSGMQVEIFINETKEHGGIKIGETTSQLGKFQTEVTLPSSMERGPFQLLAHAVGNEQYAESWSDPDITVYSESGIQLTGPEEVPVDTEALFRGKLMDDTGIGVANLELQVAVDGRDLPLQLTDEVGEFGFAQTFTEVGPHTIEVSLEGKDFLLGNSARLDVTAVMPAELSVAIPGEVRVAEGFPIEGLLLDARGNPITGAELTLTVGDGPPWSVATGDDGEFATTGSIESVGDSVIRAEFLGEYPALPAFHSATVTARHLTAMAFSGPSRVMQREEAVFQGRITSKSLPDIGSLEVLIEDRGGTLIDTVTTEMDGSFEYRSPGLADAGPRVLTARFQEQQRLTSSSASLSLAVVAPTVLTVEGPDLIRAGATADLSGVLRTEDGQSVPGVPVWVGDPESRPLITDANGAFGREFPVEAELSDSTVAATVNIPFGFDGTDRLAPSLRNHAVAVGVPWLSAEPTDTVARGETATLRGSVLLGSRPLPDVVVSAEPGFRAVTNATGSFVLQYPVSTDTPLGRNEIAVSVVDLNLEAGVPVNVKSSVNLVVVPLEDVRPSREAILQATLYDDKGQGIPGAVLRTSQGQEAITNNAGTALLKLTVPDSEDMLAFPVTFNYEGDHLHTPLSYFAGIPITQSSFNWLLWAGLPALVVAVLVSGFAASRFGSLALPTGVWVRTRRRARGDEATATEGPASEEHESPDVALEPVPDPDPTSLTVTLETPAPDLSAVWGLGEQIPVHITLSLWRTGRASPVRRCQQRLPTGTTCPSKRTKAAVADSLGMQTGRESSWRRLNSKKPFSTCRHPVPSTSEWSTSERK